MGVSYHSCAGCKICAHEERFEHCEKCGDWICEDCVIWIVWQEWFNEDGDLKSDYCPVCEEKRKKKEEKKLKKSEELKVEVSVWEVYETKRFWRKVLVEIKEIIK